jgi:putative DNA primase/helicase
MQDSLQPIPAREELEASILATLLRRQERLPGLIEHLRPSCFQLPIHATIAQAMVEIYRLRGCVEGREFVMRLKAEESHLANWLMEMGKVLPPEADLLKLLAADAGDRGSGTLSTPLEKFATQTCQWLWPGRIELAQLALIGGEAGAGKSLLACDLAARVTSGRGWPDAPGSTAAGSVIVVASADDVTSAVRPRLEAAGADVRRVRVFALAGDVAPRQGIPGSLGLADKLGLLEQAVAELDDCRLVVIDPLHIFNGGAAKAAGRGAAVRLESLAELARRRQVAVVGVVSLAAEGRRNRDLAQALRAAGGSRTSAAWLVARHPHRNEVRLLLPAKNTHGPDKEGLAFTIDAEFGREQLLWQDAAPVADLRGGRSCETARWLRQALADGPLRAKELLQLGEQNGYTPRMLHYAKSAAGVAAVRDGFGAGAVWHWLLLAAHELAPPSKNPIDDT